MWTHTYASIDFLSQTNTHPMFWFISNFPLSLTVYKDKSIKNTNNILSAFIIIFLQIYDILLLYWVFN